LCEWRKDRMAVADIQRFRWRRASDGDVLVLNALTIVLGSLRLEKHSDKTFIGRIERGFDFLGYHFGPHDLTVAYRTLIYAVLY
jgi:hypothetical protein